MYDVIINNGRYFDGTGAPSSIKSVAISDGKVIKVSSHPFKLSTARQAIDATENWITPGFIDSHTHDDRAVFFTDFNCSLFCGLVGGGHERDHSDLDHHHQEHL